MSHTHIPGRAGSETVVASRTPMISVVICSYNRAERLRQTLETLRRMSVPPELEWELIVVDNNSTDGTRKVVEEFARTSGLDVRYVIEPKQGLSNARNTGVANARGEIIAFTDDDVRVSPAWVAELVRTFREFDCMGVAGRIIPAWDGTEKPAWLLGMGRHWLCRGPLLDFDLGEESKPTREPPWGACMAFRRVAFERYGLFRIDLGVSGGGRLLGEDTEFGKRLVRGQETIMYSPRAVVFHPVDRSRVKKEYILTHWFNLGRTLARERGHPAGATLWFGVPCRKFGGLLLNFVRWMGSFEAAKRFYYRAQVYHSLGQIAEARALRAEKKSAVRLESHGG